MSFCARVIVRRLALYRGENLKTFDLIVLSHFQFLTSVQDATSQRCFVAKLLPKAVKMLKSRLSCCLWQPPLCIFKSSGTLASSVVGEFIQRSSRVIKILGIPSARHVPSCVEFPEGLSCLVRLREDLQHSPAPLGETSSWFKSTCLHPRRHNHLFTPSDYKI